MIIENQNNHKNNRVQRLGGQPPLAISGVVIKSEFDLLAFLSNIYLPGRNYATEGLIDIIRKL